MYSLQEGPIKKYDNISFFVSFILHCPLPIFVTLSFITVVCYNTIESDVWLTVHRNSVWIRKTN